MRMTKSEAATELVSSVIVAIATFFLCRAVFSEGSEWSRGFIACASCLITTRVIDVFQAKGTKEG